MRNMNASNSINNQASSHPCDLTIQQRFSEIVNRNTNKVALDFLGRQITYEDLYYQSLRLATRIRKHGIRRGSIVLILADRSQEMIAGIMGILMSGAAYLPVDPQIPSERLTFILNDSGATLAVVQGSALERAREIQRLGRVVLDLNSEHSPNSNPLDDFPTMNQGTDPAYVIYTSGSTGKPKGVVIQHRSVVSLCCFNNFITIKPLDRVLQLANFTFDASVFEIFVAILNGISLIIVQKDIARDVVKLGNFILEQRITIALFTTGHFNHIITFAPASLAKARCVLFGGEKASPLHVAKAFRMLGPGRLINVYGPTEACVIATTYTVETLTNAESSIPIGIPIPNTQILILGNDSNVVPAGMEGELCIVGDGVALGYLNRPELTKEKFTTTSPFTKGGETRMYRTGDIARYLPNGQLEFKCRMDYQVKIRGYRVEPGEIEKALLAHPAIQEAVVIPHTLPSGDLRLLAYLTSATHNASQTLPTTEGLRSFLKAKVPDYMIPAFFAYLPALPLTPNGKVDREALSAHNNAVMRSPSVMSVNSIDQQNVSTQRPQTQNTIEKRVSEVWAEQLDQPDPGPEDDFFEIGGDSLSAVAVIHHLEREFECRINDLYEHPILADFARCCRPLSNHFRAIIDAYITEYRENSTSNTHEKMDSDADEYGENIRRVLQLDLRDRCRYKNVLLTGATGYLGSYLLRELLADPELKVTAIVREEDNKRSQIRLRETLVGYFGPMEGVTLGNSPRLEVIAGNLRRKDFFLSPRIYDRLANTLDAIYHCAANVKHFGHLADFRSDNVEATSHLLTLAMRPRPADFHYVSTLSVAGSCPPNWSKLFTEYDSVPACLDDNYYIRTKQEAERLVVAARDKLANVCIHRIGNVSFPSDSTRLQRNIHENSFFRQLAAFIQIGAVPLELPASISHADVVARALVTLSRTKSLPNEIHHIATGRRDRLADFIRTAEGMANLVEACDMETFLVRLQETVEVPDMEGHLTECMGALGLLKGSSISGWRHGPIIVTDRTQALLGKLGIFWPPIPQAGQNALVCAANNANRSKY